MPPKQRKIAVMGFRSVGKSSITIQFVENQFVDSYNPTIENSFQKKICVGGHEYDLEVMDTAGQDEYSVFQQSHGINIDGYILIYSVNSRKSFEVVKIIYEKILDMKGLPQVPLVLVGNKTDLIFEREISFEEGKKVAVSWKAAFIESSAKENKSVGEIFHHAILCIEKQSGNIPQEKSSCVVS